MGWVLRVFQSRKRSHMPLLKISCHSPTRVLLPALENMESKGHTSYRSYQRTFTIRITEVQHLNYWERLHEHQLYFLQRLRERYIIIYIWKITQHMVPNIDGTMGHKIKTRKHPRHGTQCVIQCPTNRNPAQSLQQNSITVFGPRLHNSLPKYLRDIESVKTEKYNLELDKFQKSSFLMSPKCPTICQHIRKEQHPRIANSSEGARNLPWWWTPRLGHEAVLAASKPLQVCKYEKTKKLILLANYDILFDQICLSEGLYYFFTNSYIYIYFVTLHFVNYDSTIVVLLVRKCIELLGMLIAVTAL